MLSLGRCKLAWYTAGSPKLAFLALVQPSAHINHLARLSLTGMQLHSKPRLKSTDGSTFVRINIEEPARSTFVYSCTRRDALHHNHHHLYESYCS